MSARIRVLTAGLILSYSPTNSMAFGLFTHGLITDRAYQLSALGSSPNGLTKLGLQDLDNAFGDTYYDFTSGSTTTRSVNNYERSLMPKGDIDNNYRRIRGWILRGAIREDDGALPLLTFSTQPYFADPDPFGNINRFCNHFFDPVNLRPLTSTFLSDPGAYVFCPNSQNLMAPNWALGSADAFAATPQEIDNFRNHYSIFSARESMWRALTLTQKGGSRAPKAASESDEDSRKYYWATTFRALGDALHLNQDMAQPQHTRNEGHGTGHAAIFESYLDARAFPDDINIVTGFEIDAEKLSVRQLKNAPLSLTPDYAIPKFARYADYWSTAPGSASVTAAGKGLADYSSRGFLTPAKNVNTSANDMVLPNRSSSSYARDYVVAGSDPCSPQQGGVYYLLGDVRDSITGSADTIRMASDSLLNGQYTINRCGFDDRAKLLLPRAVAYSAGLIDYFFRGELEISLPDEGVYAVVDYSKESKKDTGGFNKVKLKLKNKTPDISPSGGGATVAQTLEPSGTVVAVAKFRRNKCYSEYDLQGEIPVLIKNGKTVQQIYDDCRAAAEEIVVSDPVTLPSSLKYSDADPVPLTFDFKDRIPINVIDLYLQVVYRGKLGEEPDAVVVGTKDVSEPTFIKISEYRAVYDSGGCKFVNHPESAGSSTAFNIKLNTSASPTFLVEAEVNGLQYSMFAVIADYGDIPSAAKAVPNGYDPAITLLYFVPQTYRINIDPELNTEGQPVPGSNTQVVVPAFRRSQFNPTGPNSLKLDSGPDIEIDNVGGMFIDTGFFIDTYQKDSQCPDSQRYGGYTKVHAPYPKYSPLVPKALKKVTF